MPLRIQQYEKTPNPNALKCVLSSRLIEPKDAPRSYKNAEAARGDALAEALFASAPVTTLLVVDNWITVNKAPDADWNEVKAGIERVLAEQP